MNSEPTLAQVLLDQIDEQIQQAEAEAKAKACEELLEKLEQTP